MRTKLIVFLFVSVFFGSIRCEASGVESTEMVYLAAGSKKLADLPGSELWIGTATCEKKNAKGPGAPPTITIVYLIEASTEHHHSTPFPEGTEFKIHLIYKENGRQYQTVYVMDLRPTFNVGGF